MKPWSLPSSYWTTSLLLPVTLIVVTLSIQEINAQTVNDSCEKSIPLIPNGPVMTGSTVNALPSGFCDAWDGAGLGAWYSITGTGNTMRVTTCFPETDFSTKLVVQTLCQTSDCIGNDPDFLPEFPCSSVFGTTFTWLSEKDQAYLIQVRSSDESLGGNFGVAAYEFPAPSNSRCADALPIPSFDTVLTGTTVNTTWSVECSTFYSDRLAWYSVNGTGNYMTASTCHPNTEFNAVVNVRDNCAVVSGACLRAANVDFTVPCTTTYGTTMTWASVENQVYSIEIGSSSLVGNFGLSVTDYPPPSNGICQDAIPLAVNGDEIKGTTIGTPLSSWCAQSEGYGVWYSFDGTGNAMTVSTCSSLTDFEYAVVSIQTSCDSDSACVGDESNIDTAGVCSTTNGDTVTFDSAKGQKYYVAVGDVGSWGYVAGNFGISVIDTGSPSTTSTPSSSTTEPPSSNIIDPTSEPTSSNPFDPTMEPVTIGECDMEATLANCASKMSMDDLSTCANCLLGGSVTTQSQMDCNTANEYICTTLKECSSCSECQSDLETYMSCNMMEFLGEDCSFSSCGTTTTTSASTISESPGAVAGIAVASVVVVGGAAAAISYAFGIDLGLKLVFKNCCARGPKKPDEKPTEGNSKEMAHGTSQGMGLEQPLPNV